MIILRVQIIFKVWIGIAVGISWVADVKLVCLIYPQTILTPQSGFYEKLAKECVESGVAVDLFLFPNAYIDVATIGSVATLTGGQIYRYSYFKVKEA